ncbi:TPM domain-containing protein [Rhodobacter calidifons]|uniref:TPM domain-containing protein n=1 Tax=Rhodobacter calidifons TaxID=2715277 RepID=A0ABX0G8T7_9RHOB|nr:TPM domain-containing protein [Rhodobacter calidifons]NHB77268.1 TPM domain-containing protein [Rhodobacter calidifons]
MFLRSLAVALTLATSALAQSLPEPLSDTLSDFADVLDATAEGRIARLLAATREETGTQVVVVTLPGLDAHGGAGQGIETYAKALFNSWGVGAADRNDGILMLLDTRRREARIALGSGYDPVYDGRAARVLSTAVLPALRAGNHAEGIEAGILSIRDRLILPFQAGQPVGLTDGFADESGSGALTAILGVGGVAAIAGFGIWRQRRARVTCPNCGAATLERRREIIERPTRSEPGLGMQHLTCSACGFIDRKSYPVRWSSSEARRDRDNNRGGGGSSGGGFGGGRSSGGGATGKW